MVWLSSFCSRMLAAISMSEYRPVACHVNDLFDETLLPSRAVTRATARVDPGQAAEPPADPIIMQFDKCIRGKNETHTCKLINLNVLSVSRSSMRAASKACFLVAPIPTHCRRLTGAPASTSWRACWSSEWYTCLEKLRQEFPTAFGFLHNRPSRQ